MSGTGNLTQAALDALEAGNAYVNVHTPTNGAGEIRTARHDREHHDKPQRSAGTAEAEGQRPSRDRDVHRHGDEVGDYRQDRPRLRFSGLTGRASAAHIHIGQRGKAGLVAVPLCGPCRNGARGTANLTAAALAALENGRAYVNIHTKKNLAGEIRGQIRAVALTIA